MKTLVIGYGNTLRGDDAVGPMVADQIATLKLANVRSLAVHQLTPELAAEIATTEVIWFVDAWIGGTQPVMQRLDLETTRPTLDHNWHPGVLLSLAKTLYHAQIVGAYHLLIPAIQFEYGQAPSAIAQEAIDWAVQTIHLSMDAEVNCHA